MRAVIQRVNHACVEVKGEIFSRIGMGMCCLIGIEAGDGPEDIDYIARKICGLRIFDDKAGVMNLDVSEAGGEILLISQFTLLGDARRGRRPSYSRSEEPHRAKGLFDDLTCKLRCLYPGGRVETGKFQAMMDVEIINIGPVTIVLDSKKIL